MALVAESAVSSPAVVADQNAAASAISWAAVIAGAVAAVAITLLLVALGAGIGLSSVSPWSSSNPSSTTFTLLAAVWLIIVQWLSSGLGGYLAGRLRTKWTTLHTDEVFFRDTAHGFLPGHWHQSLSRHLPRHRSHRPSVLPGAQSQLSLEAPLLQLHRPRPISLRVPATISWIRCSERISRTLISHRLTRAPRQAALLPAR